MTTPVPRDERERIVVEIEVSPDILERAEDRAEALGCDPDDALSDFLDVCYQIAVRECCDEAESDAADDAGHAVDTD